MGENVKVLKNHFIGLRFHIEPKPCRTFRCAAAPKERKLFWNNAAISEFMTFFEQAERGRRLSKPCELTFQRFFSISGNFNKGDRWFSSFRDFLTKLFHPIVRMTSPSHSCLDVFLSWNGTPPPFWITPRVGTGGAPPWGDNLPKSDWQLNSALSVAFGIRARILEDHKLKERNEWH